MQNRPVRHGQHNIDLAIPHTSMFKFPCPHCQQNISVDEDYTGKNVKCPTCGSEFVVSSTDQENEIEATPTQGTADEILSNPELNSSHTFSDRLRDGNKTAQEGAKVMKQGAMVGWAGLKRRSRQAALKAQTEKIRNIDLRKALHTLGKKAFEQGVLETELAEHFQAIRELDSRVSEMREKAVADSEETKMETLKRVSKDTAKASQAQALSLKREHLITELGREVNAQKDRLKTQELSDESAVIADIENRIWEKEEEIRGLGDGGKSGKQTLAVAAVLGLLVVAGALFGFRIFHGNNNPVATQEEHPTIDGHTEVTDKSTDFSSGGSKPSVFYESLSIRGIKLGMNEDEVKKILTDLIGSDLQFYLDKKQHKQNVKSYFFASPSLGKKGPDSLEIQASNNYMDIDSDSKVLVGIGISGSSFIKVFNAEDVMFEDFCQQFMQKHNIAKLEHWKTNYEKSYKYNNGNYECRFSLDVAGGKGFAMDVIKKASF